MGAINHILTLMFVDQTTPITTQTGEHQQSLSHEVHMPDFNLIGPVCDWKVCYTPVGVAKCVLWEFDEMLLHNCSS